MSATKPMVPADELVEIPCPHVEPRITYQIGEPRKLNNLTLIDGKTFLSTSVAGDITPPGAPDAPAAPMRERPRHLTGALTLRKEI